MHLPSVYHHQEPTSTYNSHKCINDIEKSNNLIEHVILTNLYAGYPTIISNVLLMRLLIMSAVNSDS